MLLISDASILIDIECGELTSAMFSLPWQFAVPDILFEEELAERHGHLTQFGLISKTMSGDLVVPRQLPLPVDDNYLCRSPTKKLVTFSS